MNKHTRPSPISMAPKHHATARDRRLVMQNLLAVEDNPLTADEVAMFEMFEREGWTHERRRAHIVSLFQRFASPEAAE